MPQLVTSAAHFFICHCNRHGQVITALGVRGGHSVTKRQARATLIAFVDVGLVQPDEFPEASRQIDESALPSQSDELEPLAIEIINGRHGLYDPDEDVSLTAL